MASELIYHISSVRVSIVQIANNEKRTSLNLGSTPTPAPARKKKAPKAPKAEFGKAPKAPKKTKKRKGSTKSNMSFSSPEPPPSLSTTTVVIENDDVDTGDSKDTGYR